MKANLFRCLCFSIQERFCKFVGKEIHERSHKESRDYRACSDDCTDTVNGGAGEEVESDSEDDADNIGDYPYIFEFTLFPGVGDYEGDCVICRYADICGHVKR